MLTMTLGCVIDAFSGDFALEYFDERSKSKKTSVATHEHVTVDEYARQQWQRKIDAELKAIAEADDMCRCGHKKREHKDHPLTNVVGPAAVVAMGMQLNACMHDYVEGVTSGCDCPAFLRVEVDAQ